MANESMGLIGTKIGMTQIFSDDGDAIAVTVVAAGPNTVLQVKSAEGNDGYNAIQLGFGSQKDSRLSKALRGHLAKSNSGGTRTIKEIRLSAEKAASYEPGQSLSAADVFEAGTFVDATGTSKGKGFAGVMKRYNFAGFIRSHGTHEFFRHGGSIGTRLTPGRVFKGKKMPGRMGGVRKTVQNLKLVRIDAERNLLFLRGGVPGPNGSTVIIRNAVKK